MSTDRTLTFSDGTYTYDIADRGGFLQNIRYTPRKPIQKFVEVPGRTKPLDISRAATGNMGYTPATWEYDVAFIGTESMATNDYRARAIESLINGEIMTVQDFSGTHEAEIAVTRHEHVGRYTTITIQATEV